MQYGTLRSVQKYESRVEALKHRSKSRRSVDPACVRHWPSETPQPSAIPLPDLALFAVMASKGTPALSWQDPPANEKEAKTTGQLIRFRGPNLLDPGPPWFKTLTSWHYHVKSTGYGILEAPPSYQLMMQWLQRFEVVPHSL